MCSSPSPESQPPPASASVDCPACGKAGQAGPACQRCGCDLIQLHRVSAAAARALHHACCALRELNWQEALDASEQAWELRHSPEAARMAFLAAGALGDKDAILYWRAQAQAAA